MDAEQRLLTLILDPGATKAAVSCAYAGAIASPVEVDWPTVNRAIINRWSVASLIRIKKVAWEIQGPR